MTVSVSDPGAGVLLLRAITIAFGGSRLQKRLQAAFGHSGELA